MKDKDGFHILRCQTCDYWVTDECPRRGITYLKDADMVIEIVGCASHSKISHIEGIFNLDSEGYVEKF